MGDNCKNTEKAALAVGSEIEAPPDIPSSAGDNAPAGALKGKADDMPAVGAMNITPSKSPGFPVDPVRRLAIPSNQEDDSDEEENESDDEEDNNNNNKDDSGNDRNGHFAIPKSRKALAVAKGIFGGPGMSCPQPTWEPPTKFTWSQPAKSPPAQGSHLEAFILQPSCWNSKDAVTWSLKVEPLPLDEVAMQAHVKKADLDNDLVNMIGMLLPDQVRLINERAAACQGSLVIVQYGAPTDMATPMGTFQVKSVIFIIRTGTKPEKETTAASALFTLGSDKGVPLTSQVTSKPHEGSARGANVVANNTGTSQHYVPVYKDGCYLVKKDAFTPFSEEHYMTITAQDGCKTPGLSYSLEEIRLADYAAGLKGPFPGPPGSTMLPKGPRAMTTRGLCGTDIKDGGLLGGQRSTTTGGPFGTTTRKEGLFGGSAASDLQAKPVGDLHGNSGSTSGRLFAVRVPPAFDDGSNKFYLRPISSFGQANNTASKNSLGSQTAPASHEAPSGGKLSAPATGSDKRSDTPVFGKVSNMASNGMFGGRPPSQRTSTSPFQDAGVPPANSNLFAGPAKPPSHGLFGTFPQSTLSSFFTTPKSTSTPNLFPHRARGQKISPTSVGHAAIPPCKCEKCGIALLFHTKAESTALLCDACKGNEETSCWLCVKKDNSDEQATTSAQKQPESAPKEQEIKDKDKATNKTTHVIQIGFPNRDRDPTDKITAASRFDFGGLGASADSMLAPKAATASGVVRAVKVVRSPEDNRSFTARINGRVVTSHKDG